MSKLAGIILLGLVLGAGAGETKIAGKSVLVRMMCECGGEMEPTGVCLTSSPPQYPHVCNKCGKGATYYVTYPELRYVTEAEDMALVDEGDPITGVVPDYPRLSPAVTNLCLVTNMSYDIDMAITWTNTTVGETIDCDDHGIDMFDITNVPPAMVKKLVKRWAAQGKICEVLGRHFWEDGSKPDSTGLVWSSHGVRHCAICGKVETFKPGEWE